MLFSNSQCIQVSTGYTDFDAKQILLWTFWNSLKDPWGSPDPSLTTIVLEHLVNNWEELWQSFHEDEEGLGQVGGLVGGGGTGSGGWC